IYLDLILGKYRACLTKCKSSYNSYFQRDKKNVNDWPQPDFPLWKAVHCWKLGIMRAMILPFKYLGRNIAVAGGANHYWTISEPVLAHIYGEDVPKSFKGSNIRGDLINAERQRIIRRFRQKKMGKVEEKEDLIRNGNRQETVEDAEVVEKTGGFLPVNDELYGIRYQRFFPGFHYTA
ncbi:MAG: hypothetical protein L6R42_008665, partial [Xanthoria sp. 1 TBL-2021]